MRGVAGAVMAGALGSGAAGCFNWNNARPLTADAFVSRRIEGRANPQPIDQPGLIIPDGVKPPVYEGTEPPEVTGISPSVREVVRAQGAGGGGRGSAGSAPTQSRSTPGAVTESATPSASDDAGAERGTPDGESTNAEAPAAAAAHDDNAPDPSGQYVVFGTVLAKVNNQPIYAHKVLTILDSALRAEARRYDARAFRRVAAEFIAKEIRNQQREELVFAAAQKVLAERERALADVLTARWRNEEVTKAGGSLEMAKRRWADEGWDFDERVEYQYRASMYMVYIEKRVTPLVQVTASDIRRYYDANRTTLFTKQGRVKFRVIKIDPRNRELKLAGPADARRLAERIRADALGGDFEALAREANDPALKESDGLVGADDGWLPKGTYVAEGVEDAVWNLQPGQVTDVIEEQGAFYVARLEERQDARELPFEDLAVQEQIRDTLRAEQLRELTEREQDRLIKEAVIQEQPGMLQTAVDMAMQRYPAWASAR